MVRREIRTALGHITVLPVVPAAEVAVLNGIYQGLDGGIHIPDRTGDDAVGGQFPLVLHIAEGQLLLLFGGFDSTVSHGEDNIRSAFKQGQAGFLVLGRIKKAADISPDDLDFGIGGLGPGDIGVENPVDLGDVHLGQSADNTGLGYTGADDPAEISRLLDPVIEDGKVRFRWAQSRTEAEGDLGVVLGHPAHDFFIPEGVSGDDVITALAVFPKDFFEVGVSDMLGHVILEAGLLGNLQAGLVDAVRPGFLDRGRVAGGQF